MGEGLSGPQEEPVLLSQKEGTGNRRKTVWLFPGQGAGGAGITPFCAWGSLATKDGSYLLLSAAVC